MTLAPLRRRSGHAWKCEFPEGCHRVAFFMLTKKTRDRTSSAKFCREHCESESKAIELRKRRRCVTVGCHRQASQALFAYDASHSDLRAEWCTEHAPDGSINVVSLRCVCESIFESRLGSSGDLQVPFLTDTSVLAVNLAGTHLKPPRTIALQVCVSGLQDHCLLRTSAQG